MKTRLSLILALIIVLSSFTGVFASNFQDAGDILKDIGVLTGDDETGDLMLDKNLSRQDMVVLISRLYKKENIAKNYEGINVFKDLDQKTSFYIPYINWAKDQGLIQGIEIDEFGFGMNTSIQEFQTVLVRVLDYKDQASNWEEIPEFSKDLGLMKDLDLDVSSKLTRGQMAKMTINALDIKLKDSQETLADKLEVNIKEIFSSGIQVDENRVEFRGRAPRSKTLKIEVMPKDQPEEATITDLQVDEKGRFSHIIEELDAGDYQYRLIGDKLRSLFIDFKVEKEIFPEDDLEVEDIPENEENNPQEEAKPEEETKPEEEDPIIAD